MKRMLLSIVVLLVLLCGVAVAETTIIDQGNCGASGSNVTWTLDSAGTLTIKGEGEMEDYDSRNNSAPWYSSIKTVIIGNGVTSIGEFAFYNCSNLSSITIPKGVTSIGHWAFSGCSSLSSITIPEGVTSIGEYAFSCCISLSSITIPDGVTSIGRDAFSSCSSLSSITIPDGVTSIGGHAFSGCINLGSITIPEGVTSIEEYTFSACGSLSSITIPKGVTSIGHNTFSGCYNLSSITIPEGVTSIGDGAFYECSSLGSITIPDGVTSIGDGAFSGCSSLSSITIPVTVNTIRSSAFSSCPELKQFNVVEGSYAYRWLIINDYLGDYVAKGTCGDNEMDVIWTLDSEGTLTISGEGTMHDYSPEGTPWYSERTTIKTAVIKKGVTSIGEFAFYSVLQFGETTTLVTSPSQLIAFTPGWSTGKSPSIFSLQAPSSL